MLIVVLIVVLIEGILGLFGELVSKWLGGRANALSAVLLLGLLIRWTHGAIIHHLHSHRLHYRSRQRILRSQDATQVPDSSLSRAQPPGEPTPTDTALSVADTTAKKERLAASTDTSTEAEVPVRR